MSRTVVGVMPASRPSTLIAAPGGTETTFSGTVRSEVGIPEASLRADRLSVEGAPIENTWNATFACCPASRSAKFRLPLPMRTLFFVKKIYGKRREWNALAGNVFDEDLRFQTQLAIIGGELYESSEGEFDRRGGVARPDHHDRGFRLVLLLFGMEACCGREQTERCE